MMKIKIISATRSLLLLALLSIAFSCAEENDVTPKKVRFNFSPATGPSSGKMKDEATPYSIMISVENDSGPVLTDQVILLAKFGAEYFTVEGIEVPEGNYTLTKFLVFNDAEEVIMACPVEGSEKAYLVSNPLPLNFIVSSEAVTEVSVEIVALDQEEDTPEQFGYGFASFTLNPVQTFNFNLRVVDYATQQGIAESVLIQGFNGDDEMQLERAFQTSASSSVNIELLSQLPYYRITVEKEGYYDVEYFLTRAQIQNKLIADVFVIGLINQDQYHQVEISPLFHGNSTTPAHSIAAYAPVDGCSGTAWIDFGGFAPYAVELVSFITESDETTSYELASSSYQNDNVGNDFFGVFALNESNICTTFPNARFISTSIYARYGQYELQISFDWDKNTQMWQAGQLVTFDPSDVQTGPQELFYQEYAFN